MSIDDNAFLNSCLAINGHRNQLTITADTVPTIKATPRVQATVKTGTSSGAVYAPNETTTNEMQPTIPDRGWGLCVNRYIIGIMNMVANTAITYGFPLSAP